MEPLNLHELEDLARQTLTPQNFDYIAGGADDEVTVRTNRQAFARWQICPRVLVDVSEVELGIELLGRRISLPVLLAPTAFHALAHPEAERATARAAAAAETIFVLSSLSSQPLAEVAAAADGPRWYQLYCPRDRTIARGLVERAVESGYEALCLTVDVPVVGRREKDLRHPFRLPPEALPKDLLSFIDLTKYPPHEHESALNDLFARFFDPSLTWRDLEWLRSLSSLPFILKGILCAEDARLALEHGVDAIIVSNHGGRQLDGVPAALEVLEEISETVAGRIPILVDGGIRRGTDVVKALALGADAVLIGRPYLWGLAVNGQAGVRHVIEMLREEIRSAMALAGCPRVTQLGKSFLRPA